MNRNRGSMVNAFYIADILADYPFIRAEQIDLLSPVYYPVADVKISYEEKSFENFDVIPQLVLSLIDAGISDVDTIGEMLSLSGKYIKGILRQLYSQGQIEVYDDFPVPSVLGRQTLEECRNGKRVIVREHSGSQIFKMDALSGRLLRLDETMEERNLADKDHLFANVLIDAKDGVNFDLSDNELLQDCRRFIDYNRDVLNANISKVSDISFQGMHYVKSFLMALKDESILLFFRTAQRKGGKKKISVLMTNQEGKRHFPQENVPLMDEDSERRIIRSIMRIQLSERGKSAEEIGRKEMLETIAGFYDFRDFRLNEERREIVLNADSFSGYDRDLPFLLRQFSARGWILFTSRQLRGEFLKAVVKDERLKRAAESYSAYEKKNGFNAAQSALKEACERFEGRIIDAIESLSESFDQPDY